MIHVFAAVTLYVYAECTDIFVQTWLFPADQSLWMGRDGMRACQLG